MVLSKQAEKPFLNVDLLSPLGVPATYLLLAYFYAFHFLEISCVILQMHEVSNILMSGIHMIHTILCSSFSWLAISTPHHKYTDGKVHSCPLMTRHETGRVAVSQPVITPHVQEATFDRSKTLTPAAQPASPAPAVEACRQPCCLQQLKFYPFLSLLLSGLSLLDAVGPMHHPEALHN